MMTTGTKMYSGQNSLINLKRQKRQRKTRNLWLDHRSCWGRQFMDHKRKRAFYIGLSTQPWKGRPTVIKRLGRHVGLEDWTFSNQLAGVELPMALLIWQQIAGQHWKSITIILIADQILPLPIPIPNLSFHFRPSPLSFISHYNIISYS